MNIFIDIETIPDQRPGAKDRISKKLKRLKKDTDAAFEAKVEEAWRKTALDGTYGEIICVAWAIDDGEIKTAQRDLAFSEAEFLRTFLNVFEQSLEEDPSRADAAYATWIGHNILFDMRFIFQRCVINSLKSTINWPLSLRPRRGNVIDTMESWAGYKKMISLDELCRALSIPTKDTDLDGEIINGANVWDFVKRGEADKVAHYCAQDVNRVRQVYDRFPDMY